MKQTMNYGFNLPEGSDIQDVSVLDDNFSQIDEALCPTVSQNAAPTSGQQKGKLSVVVGWLANRIKAITGLANWYDTPSTTLSACASHISSGTHLVATPTRNGFISSADKRNLDIAMQKLSAYTVGSFTFDGSFGVNLFAEVVNDNLSVIADAMFIRHLRNGYSVCGKVQFHLYPNTNAELENGIVKVTDLMGRGYSGQTGNGTFCIIKHNTGGYYLGYNNNFTSSDDILDYMVWGLNIKPITPRFISSSLYTTVAFCVAKFDEQ